MASIHKEGRFYYLCYRNSEGRQRKKSLKTGNKVLAEKLLKEFEAQMAADRFGLELNTGDKLKLKAFLAEALTFSRTNKAPSTVKRDEGIYRQFLAFMGDVHIRKIRPKDLEAYKLHLIERGLTPGGVNVQLRHLSAAFGLAVRYDYLAANPFKRVPRLRVPKKKPVFLSSKQARELLTALKGNRLHGIVLIALNTGARLGEILGLRWENVRLNPDQPDEHASIKVFGKGSRERTIPITDTLRAYLKERQQRSGLVVGEKLKVSNISHSFRIAADRQGLTGFTFHNLRDTYASWLVQQGVNLKIIQELLGHSSIQTTMIYAHLTPDARFSAARSLDAIMDRLASSSPEDQVREAMTAYHIMDRRVV